MTSGAQGARHDVDRRRGLTNRLRRIEGQVRGVERMLDDERPCVEVLTQIAAIRTALESFATEVLDVHVRRCLRDRHDKELIEAIRRFAQTR